MDRFEELNVFEQLRAPILCCAETDSILQQVIDINIEGIRFYSDEPHPIGHRLDLSLVLGNQDRPLHCIATIRGLSVLSDRSFSRYDLGASLQFYSSADFRRLSTFLGITTFQRNKTIRESLPQMV